MCAQHQTGARMGLFEDLDRMDADAWASHLAPGAVMRFGNADPVLGRAHCRDALAALFARIGGLRHQIVERWEHGAATIVESSVTYVRTDGREVTLPAVTIYRTDDEDLIFDYRVYVDPSPVFADGG
jgi:hypothetical protein